MFERLIESGTGRRWRAVQAAISVVVHGGLLLLGVRATTIDAAPNAPALRLDTIIWTTDPAPAEPAVLRPSPVPERRHLPPVADAATRLPVPLADAAALTRSDAVPLIGSSGVVDLDGLTRAPRTHAGFDSDIGAGTDADDDSSRVFSAAQLDRSVELIEQPLPVYPRALRDAGVTGYVDAEFVVRRNGDVEPGSIVVLAATHEAFATSARAAIAAARFRPATLRGQTVRQLVRQRVRFDASVATAPTSW